MSLVLGLFASIALLSIPAIISPTHQGSTPNTEGTTPTFALAERFTGSQSTGSDSSNGTSEALSLALGLFLILLPASVLSFLTRRWAGRKLPDWYK